MAPTDKIRQSGLSREELKVLISQEQDALKAMVHAMLQEVLEAEMDQALGAGKGQRSDARRGYRSGYYARGQDRVARAAGSLGVVQHRGLRALPA